MRSTIAATVFMALIFAIGLIVCVATANIMSRLTWALVRDKAFYGSQYLEKVNEKLQVPVWSISSNAGIVSIFGFMYLASTTGT
jgi:choline transport protein